MDMTLTRLFRSAAALGAGSLLLLTLSAGRAAAQMTPPAVKQHIYDDNANPDADIKAALERAQREHKRVLIDFGGDWCGDCQVLDIYFHREPNHSLLEKNYVLVHVAIGRMDKHLDVGQRYGADITKGVPALVVLTAKGKPVYAEQRSAFRDARSMSESSVTEFLNKWKS